MSRQTLNLTDRLYDYLLGVSLREPPLLARLRDETAKVPMAVMQIAPEQGQFMALLVELIGARRSRKADQQDRDHEELAHLPSPLLSSDTACIIPPGRVKEQGRGRAAPAHWLVQSSSIPGRIG